MRTHPLRRHLLDFHKIDVDGKYVVILGRSNVVGKPLSLMMLGELPPDHGIFAGSLRAPLQSATLL